MSPISYSLQLRAVSPVSHCLQFLTVSDFALSPISWCLQFHTVSHFVLCLQFRSVSNFALSPISQCLQFRTVSNFAVSPISYWLRFRTVSNFALRLQVFTVSPVSCLVSRSPHLTYHPATSHVNFTTSHFLTPFPSHTATSILTINFLQIFCFYYLVHIRPLMSQFYLSIPPVHYMCYHHRIDTVTLLHVSTLKWPSSTVLIHFLSRVNRIPAQVKEQPAACYLAAVCKQNKETCICFFVSERSSAEYVYSVCCAHVWPSEFGFQLLFSLK